MKPTPQCALGRLMPSKTDSEQIKHDGWHQQQILVVAANDPRLDFVDKEFIRQLGEKLYGRNSC